MKLLLPQKIKFICKDSRVRSVTECLVGRRFDPINGWAVRFSIGGQIYETSGMSYKDAIRSMAIELSKNGIEPSLNIAGATCNYSWLKEAKKEALINPDELKKYCVLIEDAPPQFSSKKKVEKEKAGTDFWGKPYWEVMNHELSMDMWTIDGFRRTIRWVLIRLNQDINPSRGCNDCYNHFKSAVEDYDKTVFNLEQAREWLWKTHNESNDRSGKKKVSYEKIKKKFKWD